MVKIDAFAKTKAGVLQGVQIDGIYRFLGVRYAQSTEGKNRFQPPQPLIPWEGVKLATEYAGKSWQTDTPRMEDPEIRCTKYPGNYEKMCEGTAPLGSGTQSEDCLALNIWSQGLDDGKKRPVLVWFHGGGNVAGGAEAYWHDGYNMAKEEDIVLISVGHRLGIFGYFYLGDCDDPRFKNANVGHQDMAMALQWIHDNIEAFGGDPDNVTIFGQSGGGGKVATLMAMPSTKGLISKAIMQSGGYMANPVDEGTRHSRDLCNFMGIDNNNLDKLFEMSAADLIQASRDLNATRTVGTYFGCPVILDGEVIKHGPFDGAEGTEFSKHIPVISCFDKDDNRLVALFDPPIFTYTMEELPEKLAKLDNCSVEEANKIIDMYKGILGEDCNACDIVCTYYTDMRQMMRTEARYAARENVEGAAPVYSCAFCFESKDPDFKAAHGVEIPFFFGNACYAPGIWDCDTYQGAMQLNDAARSAWANFARTGNPSNKYMPQWLPYDKENRYTMAMDVESKLVSDYHKAAREYLEKK